MSLHHQLFEWKESKRLENRCKMCKLKGSDWIIRTFWIVAILLMKQIFFIIARNLKLGKYVVDCAWIIE